MAQFHRGRRLLLALAGAAVAAPLPAPAQIEEVLVTTRKREESLQEVPIAVAVVGAEQIDRLGIADLTDVAQLVPSVQFDTAFGPQDTRVTIRGLSNTRGRSNVAFLVDGIDVTTENAVSAGSGLLANKRLLTDTEQIEVVKGPQSALYGRAAFAGAISYVTKEPGDEFEGLLRVDAGDYGRRQFDAAFGGPVLPGVLGLRVSGVHWNEDGYYTNSVSGEGVGGGSGFGTALTAVWTPADRLKLKARMEYSEDEYDPPATVRIDGDTVRTYPQNALDAGVGITSAFQGTATNLPDFGVFCGPGVDVPAGSPPGFCIPRSFGSARDKTVAQSENPETGGDFPGTEVDLFRTTLVATLELDSWTLSSYSGYTDAKLRQHYDQDYQAEGRPDRLLSTMITDTDQDTTQFSQELRLATNWDGPVQLTFGGLYWDETRDLRDRNVIIACLPVTTTVQGDLVTDIPGVCDGTDAGGWPSVSSWQEYYLQDLRPDVPGFRGAVWEADTEHLSAYLAVEWSMTDELTLTFENRYVYEEFNLLRPNQASCASIGFAVAGGNLVFPLLTEEAAQMAGQSIHCEAWEVARQKVEQGLDPNGLDKISEDQLLDWTMIQGRTRSRFNTPRLILGYTPSDDMYYYFSWARAQKPGGINQLEAGAAATVIENERFLPEKMEAWELGAKTSWAAAGYLQFNSALFLQDYTDKQVTTQLLIDGNLTPRVTNASAARIWGLEFDLLWQPDFMEGLTLGASYTWLDAEYVDYNDDTTVLVRAAAAGECSSIVYKGGEGPNPNDLSDPANGAPTCRIDQSGSQLERTPRHAASATVNLRRPFMDSASDWLLGLNGSWQDERYLDADNFTRLDDYWLVNLQLGLVNPGWEVVAYVDNLLDDDTLRTGGSGPDFGRQVTQLGFTAGLGVLYNFGPLPDPRVFGVRFTKRFGATR